MPLESYACISAMHVRSLLYYEPSDVFDVANDFGETNCTDSAYYGNKSRVVMPGESVTVPVNLTSTYYMHVAFFDQYKAENAPSIMQLHLATRNNTTLNIGIDTVQRSSLYMDKYIFSLSNGSELPQTIGQDRSRGWHSLD